MRRRAGRQSEELNRPGGGGESPEESLPGFFVSPESPQPALRFIDTGATHGKDFENETVTAVLQHSPLLLGCTGGGTNRLLSSRHRPVLLFQDFSQQRLEFDCNSSGGKSDYGRA